MIYGKHIAPYNNKLKGYQNLFNNCIRNEIVPISYHIPQKNICDDIKTIENFEFNTIKEKIINSLTEEEKAILINNTNINKNDDEKISDINDINHFKPKNLKTFYDDLTYKSNNKLYLRGRKKDNIEKCYLVNYKNNELLVKTERDLGLSDNDYPVICREIENIVDVSELYESIKHHSCSFWKLNEESENLLLENQNN